LGVVMRMGVGVVVEGAGGEGAGGEGAGTEVELEEEAEVSGVETLALLSRMRLLRSSGVRPRLFRISALFSQNSSMMSAFFEGVSSEEESRDPAGPAPVAFWSLLGMGVEVTAGMGWVLTGEAEASGEVGSRQGSDCAQMGERGFPVRGQMERLGYTGEMEALADAGRVTG